VPQGGPAGAGESHRNGLSWECNQAIRRWPRRIQPDAAARIAKWANFRPEWRTAPKLILAQGPYVLLMWYVIKKDPDDPSKTYTKNQFDLLRFVKRTREGALGLLRGAARELTRSTKCPLGQVAYCRSDLFGFDILPTSDGLLLMELELIEPALFLTRMPRAAKKLASELLRSLS
jgi:hypothetical protein